MLVYGQGCYETEFSVADGRAPSAAESLLTVAKCYIDQHQ